MKDKIRRMARETVGIVGTLGIVTGIAFGTGKALNYFDDFISTLTVDF